MVVLGIIVVLISILLPTISKARHQANTVRCLSNMKQLVGAAMLYSSQYNNTLAFTGWGSNSVPNWLYDPTRPPTYTPQDLQYSQLWPFIRYAGIYRCPEDVGPWPVDKYQSVCSYVMNGAASGYGTNNNAGLDMLRFRPDAILFWEIPFSIGVSGTSNDGTNYPPEGVAARHNSSSTIGYMDGHVELMNWQDYVNLCQPTKPDGTKNVPNALWCDPTDKINGGAYKYSSGVYPPSSIPVQD
jgi:prepilin-type processing-associated H-X9-DG protein